VRLNRDIAQASLAETIAAGLNRFDAYLGVLLVAQLAEKNLVNLFDLLFDPLLTLHLRLLSGQQLLGLFYFGIQQTP
jgi:hypothetical protein